MRDLQLSYTDFENIVLTSGMIYRHTLELVDGTKYYTLFATDDNIMFQCKMNSMTESGNITDYENNYASNANRFIKEDSFRNDRYRRKYDSISTNNTKSCTDSNWTEFYDIDFGSDIKYFSELALKCDNLDKIKIQLDEETIIETTLYSLKQVIVDNDGITMKDIDVSYLGNTLTLYLDLNYQKGSKLQIMQQRRAGSGDLTMKGYVLSYVERV